MSRVNKLSNIFSGLPVQIIVRGYVSLWGKLYAQLLFQDNQMSLQI